MIHKRDDQAPTTGDTTPEQHHGDLRKGAYLKRRAEYQMQADAAGAPQAGTLLPGGTRRHRG